MIENYSTTYIAVQTDTTPPTLVRISKNLYRWAPITKSTT